MSQYNYYSDTTYPELVATKLPEGKTLFKNAGQADSRRALLNFAKSCGNCPDNIEAVCADKVGLEWRYADGRKAPWGDSYRKGRFVIVY